MGTKPAKVGRLAPCLINQGSNPGNIPYPGIPEKARYTCGIGLFWLFSQKGLRSVGGPKLLKSGLPGRGSNLLKSGRPLTSRTPGGCTIRVMSTAPDGGTRGHSKSRLFKRDTTAYMYMTIKTDFRVHAPARPSLPLRRQPPLPA